MVTKNQVFVAVLLFFTFVQASESKEICTTYDANDFKVIASEEDQPFEIPLYKSEDNKEIKLLHEDREFFICNETKKIKVNAHRIDKDIRSVNTAYLKKMLQKGYLVVSQS